MRKNQVRRARGVGANLQLDPRARTGASQRVLDEDRRCRAPQIESQVEPALREPVEDSRHDDDDRDREEHGESNGTQ